MKNLITFNTLKFAMAICAVLPLSLNAQTDSATKNAKRTIQEFYGRPSNWRAYDQTGINEFETRKSDSLLFEGLRVRFGAGFTQQYQSIESENPGAINNGGTTIATAGSNKLYPLTPGFMTAQANLFMDVQLADGIRLNVTTYLSARHHNEAWVKGGYIQFDKLPFKGKFWDNLMSVTTIKVGHMEINYGDEHFRRSDGGHTLYNPFMEGNIMDAFATEIGGEVYVQKSGFLGMIGLSNGMIKGNVDTVFATLQDSNTSKQPSIYLKAGYDNNITDHIRIRVTGSYYHNGGNYGSGLTLYGGDRTGSNYQNAYDTWVPYNKDGTSTKVANASTAAAFSGRFNPGFTNKIDAIMLNAFAKVYGFELFGTYENAKGRSKTETADRTANQYAIEALYRFFKKENLYAGVRYNTVKAEMQGFTTDVTIDRVAFAAGWFVTKNILLKAEYVKQQYKDFGNTKLVPNSDYRTGGMFKGFVIEATVGF